ncbi:ATP-binding protein [Candidatus Thorarchaeota archaeon]|nr:MAG: ATP-binding protein [Candidatus Thorarchaeota archaeon]
MRRYQALSEFRVESTRGAQMNDPGNPDTPNEETPEDARDLDKPIELIHKSALPYHPRVGDVLDLNVDLNVGVVLGRSDSFHRKFRAIGLGMIGGVTETSDDVLTSLMGMPVNLDLMSPHVMLVAGKRGSGKSYTLGIIAEELALAMERREIEVAAVLVDTVDVFRQMVDPNDDQSDLLKKWGYEARGFPVNVYIPRRTYVGLPDEVKKKARLFPLSIGPKELSVSDWGYVLEKGGTLSTAMENLISETLDSVRKGYALGSGERVSLKRDFSIKDMIQCIDTSPSIDELYKPSTRTAMIQRLKRADRMGVFHPGGTSAQDLAIAGQITVIDVAPLGSDAEAVLAILTNMLCRQVLTYRMAWTDEGTSAREELPPTWLIIDEAHTLVPRSGPTPAKDAIIGYAKLGRRFGCSLVLCTQQPSAVSDDAISQADLIISHSLSHDNDIRALQQRAPAVLPDQFRDKVFISSLPRGAAIVFDQTTENKRGFIMQVRPRLSQHGGTDRLSGLFEAVKLLIPDEPDDVEIVDYPEEETVESEEGIAEEDIVEEEVDFEESGEDLPEVPRPPLKLSKDDWQVLDSWMKEYVQDLFEEQKQEFSITDDPSPRIEEPVEEFPLSEVEIVPATKSEVDPSDVLVKQFGPVSKELLSKATTRKILYSKASHGYLFTSENDYRDTILVDRHDTDPSIVINWVSGAISSIGLDLEQLIHEDGFTFACFRRDGARVVFSIASSGSMVSAPLVVVGVERKTVAAIADRIRSSLHNPE